MQARATQRGQEEPAVSLIFPTYNPGRTLERTQRELADFLNGPGAGWEVLFVCDGCTDGSTERLLDWAENQPHQIRVLGYAPNRGKGYAVRHGLAAARGNIRIFTDVDLSYGFDDVLRIANTLRDGADLAIASRTHAESRLVLPAHLQGYVYRRHLQTMVYSLLVRLFLRLPIRDTQAGLKGVTARAANLILRYLHCDGFAFDCELLSAAFRLGLTITEVPVCVHHHDASSTTGFSSLAEMMIDVWRIRRTWRRRLPLVQGPVEGDLRKAA